MDLLRRVAILLGIYSAYAHAQEQVIPLLTVGGEGADAYTTVVRLVSISSSPVTGTGYFLTPAGLPLSARVEGATPQVAQSFRFNVPVGGIARVLLSGAGAAVDTGWMRIVPDGRAPVFATATVLRGKTAAAAIGSSLAYQAVTFYHDSLGETADTPFMVVNPSPAPLDVELTLTESAGPNRSIVTRVIPPNGALSATANELFKTISFVDEMLGRVRITGSRAFGLAALQRDGAVFTPLPLFSGPLERYSFEADIQGWKPGASQQARAVRSCAAAEETPYSGRFSLKCEVELECLTNDRAAGEVEVDLRTNPPDAGVKAPVSLDNLRLTARVQAAPAFGSLDFRNTLQLYVRDANGKAFTGPLTPIDAGWTLIEATPTKTTASEFDSTQVTSVGVRMACPANSSLNYRGPVYLDFVVW